MRRVIGALAVACLVGCGDDPCDAMCDAARQAHRGCFDEWGYGWDALRFDGPGDFDGWCETWAWEQRLLARDRGAGGAVDDACADRTASVEAATCTEVAEIDWSTLD